MAATPPTLAPTIVAVLLLLLLASCWSLDAVSVGVDCTPSNVDVSIIGNVNILAFCPRLASTHAGNATYLK